MLQFSMHLDLFMLKTFLKDFSIMKAHVFGYE